MWVVRPVFLSWLFLIISCTIRTCRLVLRNLRSYLSVCPESSLAEPHLRFKSVHRCPFSQSSPLGDDCVLGLCPKLSVAPTTCWESQSLQWDFCPQKLQGLPAIGSHSWGSVFRCKWWWPSAAACWFGKANSDSTLYPSPVSGDSLPCFLPLEFTSCHCKYVHTDEYRHVGEGLHQPEPDFWLWLNISVALSRTQACFSRTALPGWRTGHHGGLSHLVMSCRAGATQGSGAEPYSAGTRHTVYWVTPKYSVTSITCQN